MGNLYIDIDFIIFLLLIVIYLTLYAEHNSKKNRSKLKNMIFNGIFIFLVLFSINEFLRRCVGGFAGSYPFVEYWELEAPEHKVLNAIKDIGENDIYFNPPNNYKLISYRDTGYIWDSEPMIHYLDELKKDSTLPLPEKNYANYYHQYWTPLQFFYPDTDEIVYAWTRPTDDSSKTTLALVGMHKTNNPNRYNLINKDYWFIANRKQISKFESNILDKIKFKLQLD